jgi:hypothetical protein
MWGRVLTPAGRIEEAVSTPANYHLLSSFRFHLFRIAPLRLF